MSQIVCVFYLFSHLSSLHEDGLEKRDSVRTGLARRGAHGKEPLNVDRLGGEGHLGRGRAHKNKSQRG
jgi:hypothetical protein